MIDDLNRAVQDAVRNAHGFLGLDSPKANNLTRVEISRATADALFASIGAGQTPYEFEDYWSGCGPIRYRGVAYYVIDRLPVAWRIISPAIAGRRCAAVIQDGPLEPVEAG